METGDGTMIYEQFKPRIGDRYEAVRRGCLHFLKGDQITVAKVVPAEKGFLAIVPENRPHIRLMPTTRLWRKV